MRPLILLILASLTLAAAVDKAGAEAAVARGWAALDASNSDPRKSVDAALAFSEALPYFVDAGDDESARELQADIFWARKRMRSDDLDTYLAAKRGDTGTAKAVETMTMVMDRPVAATEAADYFAKAEAFAKAHPSDHLKLAIRYFEVASRFPGTQEAMDAQKLSLDEQVQAKAGDGKAIAKAIKIDKQQPAAAKAGAKPMKGALTLVPYETVSKYVAKLADTWSGAPLTLDGSLLTSDDHAGGNATLVWTAKEPVPCHMIALTHRVNVNDDAVSEAELLINDVSVGKVKDWTNKLAVQLVFQGGYTVEKIELRMGPARNTPGVSELIVR